MAVLPIYKLPDPVLRQEAREITEINGNLQRLINDMAETMYAAPGLRFMAPIMPHPMPPGRAQEDAARPRVNIRASSATMEILLVFIGWNSLNSVSIY
jgi:hypothetical protein